MTAPVPHTVDTPRWEQRFRAPRYTLPAWAKSAPQRCAFVSDLSGIAQVYCWDRTAGSIRQVTDRPSGTQSCAIEASGRAVWWFADADGDEYGQWMRQPFEGGPDTPAAPSTGLYWPSGLAVGLEDHALLGCSTEDGAAVHLVLPGGATRLLYRHEEPAFAVDLSRALDLAVIAHSERGDLWDLGVRVLGTDGSTVADLADDEGGLEAVGFSPVRGDARLLLQHQRDDRWEPVIFDPRTGERTEIGLGLPGDVTVEWFQDARSLLVVHDHEARSTAYRYDLRGGGLTRLDTPPGTIEHARTRPDGDAWLLWSSSSRPPAFRGLLDDPKFPAPRQVPPLTAEARDLWVDGPGGRIHALLSTPDTGEGPYPTVFLLHGGPDEADQDAFDPTVAAWVDHGFAVVRVNYRGSTGYGQAWTEALRARVGLTELEDVAAVRRWTVEHGIADPRRMVLSGWSWGGYLTLLALGTQPDDWALGLAGTPVADCADAHRQAMEEIKALDRSLFGGSPDEVPERYREASPVTYVDAVRAPVLICAGTNDARCPVDQARAYAERLAERGVPHQFHCYDAGHSVTDVAERVALFRRQLDFVRAHLTDPPSC
ncbi:prolyl oligopeptidase family serine peptidase [Streptomyces olivoreticuli]|uniref:Prolyl oligopeptidase family serine peptidase n=1 Tax=Streptomyces blastmyceticus TaxID=68180 RepID=A0ABN0XPQ1_9ACTN|nr:prolyl oligopeptidase family serine peptidase [Streptomyces olivoreticuli]WKK25212.1 prolyl oligopeptidase family serine peptidase [Streptomyces olivoreticuli]